MFIIGYYLFIGKVVDLDKSYVVLYKKINDDDNYDKKGEIYYDVCVLVKKKIVFKIRFKLIVFKIVLILR